MSNRTEVSSFVFKDLDTKDSHCLLDQHDTLTEREKRIIRQQITTECLEQHRAPLIEQGIQQGIATGYETGFQAGLQAAHQDHSQKQQNIASREGYQQGFDAGWSAGQQEASAAAKKHLECLSDAVQQFNQDRVQLEKTLAQEILLLVASLVDIIVSLSIGHTDSLIQTIQKALKEIPALQKMESVVITLQTEDKKAIEQLVSGQVCAQWTLVEDANLARGGFRIHAGPTQIDATLPVRLRRTLQSIGVPVEWIDASHHG